MKHFFTYSTYPFNDFMTDWHTSGMMVDIAGTDIRNVYITAWNESPVAKERKDTAKRVTSG